jgi:hypothetical protein
MIFKNTSSSVGFFCENSGRLDIRSLDLAEQSGHLCQSSISLNGKRAHIIIVVGYGSQAALPHRPVASGYEI